MVHKQERHLFQDPCQVQLSGETMFPPMVPFFKTFSRSRTRYQGETQDESAIFNVKNSWHCCFTSESVSFQPFAGELVTRGNPLQTGFPLVKTPSEELGAQFVL